MQIYFTRWAELSVSSPSLANTDGFITEFYMICYNTFSAISYLREDTLPECNGLCWKEGQIVLQQAMSRVISPVLLLDAGSNSLYLLFTLLYYPHTSFVNRSSDHFGGLGSQLSGHQSDLQQLGVMQTHKHHHSDHQRRISHILTSHHFTDPGHTCPWYPDTGALELSNNMISKIYNNIFPLCLIAKYDWRDVLCGN